MTRSRYREGQIVAFSLSPRKVTTKSPKTTEVKLLLPQQLRFIMVCYLTAKNQKSRKFYLEFSLRKNQNGFRRKRSITSQILTIRRRSSCKNLSVTILFEDVSIHRGKMEQILLAYRLPEENVAAIMMLYKNTKVYVRSPDRETEFLDIVADVL